MAAIAKPPPVVVALLAIGAIWWLTQRRAVAAPAYGAATNANPALARYYVSPSGVVPGAAQPSASPLAAALQFASSLFGGGAKTAGTQFAGAGGGGYLVNPATAFADVSFGVPGTSVLPAVSTPRAGDYEWGGPLTSSNPLTGVYGYADGEGVADALAASFAPNVDWSALQANEAAYLAENPFALSLH